MGVVDKEGPVDEKEIGPVDCSSIADKNGDIVSKALIEGEDFELLPTDGWTRLIGW